MPETRIFVGKGGEGIKLFLKIKKNAFGYFFEFKKGVFLGGDEIKLKLPNFRAPKGKTFIIGHFYRIFLKI